MSVFKRYKGKKVGPKDEDYDKGTWYVAKRVNGVDIFKAVPEATTKVQAEQALHKLTNDVFERRYGANIRTDVRFDEFADGKYDHEKKLIEAGTYRKYVEQKNTSLYIQMTYVKRLVKYLGRKLLIDITAQDCRDLQWSLQTTPGPKGYKLAPASVNKHMSTFSRILTLAVEQEIIKDTPMRFVKQLPEPPPRDRSLTPEERERLFAVISADSLLHPAVNLALNLPIRKGQLVAITKDDCDFEQRAVRVIKSKGRGERWVPMNDIAYGILSRLCERSMGGFILSPDGEHVIDFKKRWAKALLDADINKPRSEESISSRGRERDNFTFHDLRHEFAGDLIEAGVRDKDVQHLFAHGTSAMTDRYIKKVERRLSEAVNLLNRPAEAAASALAAQGG